MVYLTRRERFSSAHRLFSPAFSDEKNEEIYGQCSNPNWHGHNYILWVTIRGQVNPETGVVINLKDLSKIIKSKVTNKLDHKNLNVEVDFLRDKIISTEVLAIGIWNQLKEEINTAGAELFKIKLEETENNFVEYYGE